MEFPVTMRSIYEQRGRCGVRRECNEFSSESVILVWSETLQNHAEIHDDIQKSSLINAESKLVCFFKPYLKLRKD